MPLQSSGPISLANLQTEFGGANPISLSEYYRGGGLVASGASASIPTSGQISLSNFYGAAGGPTGSVLLTSTSKIITNEAYEGIEGVSYAGFALGGEGKLYALANQFAPNWFEIAPTNEWLEPEDSLSAAQYECRATSSPAFVTSSTDLDFGISASSWTRLGSTSSGGRGARYWFIENNAPGILRSASFTVEIRQVGTTTVLASAGIQLNARLRTGAIE